MMPWYIDARGKTSVPKVPTFVHQMAAAGVQMIAEMPAGTYVRQVFPEFPVGIKPHIRHI